MRVAATVAIVMAVAGLLLAGCQSRGTVAYVDPGEPGAFTVQPTSATVFLPSDDCRLLRVDQSHPQQVVVGQPFRTHITVTNVSRDMVEDVLVYENDVVGNYQFTDSVPAPQSMSGGKRAWNLGPIPAGDSRLLVINGAALQTGEVCACIEVAFKPRPVCMTISAVQPALTLTHTMPEKQLVCDPVQMKIQVQNVGTGVASNVVLLTQLPEGWATSDGKGSLFEEVGDLAPGEQREFDVTVRADSTGIYLCKSEATADYGLIAAAEGTTLLVMADLEVAIDSPRERYMDTPFRQTITISNGETIDAPDAVLTYALPPGAVFVSASDGGQFADGRVTWPLGTLATNQRRTFTVTMHSCTPGANRSTAVLTSACGNAQAAADVNIVGVGALLLEMVDLCDPVAVGQQTTYRVTVTNQGTAADSDIRLIAMLPAEMSYVSASGPTQASADGRQLTFAPLAQLAPGQRAVWDIIVRADRPCNCRFEVRLTSDQIGTDRPAVKIEPTRIFE